MKMAILFLLCTEAFPLQVYREFTILTFKNTVNVSGNNLF